MNPSDLLGRLDKAQADAREEAQKQQWATKQCSDTTIGMAGSSVMGLQPCLRDRIATRLHRAQNERIQEARLEELHHLLGKHPEVARILELMDEMKPF